MGVRVPLKEMSVYGRWCWREEIAETPVRCPLMRGVRLQEASVGGGPTV